MNVYDWDNTIYRGDSTFDFVRWCMKKYPGTLRTLPRTAVYGILYGTRIVRKQVFKENMYRFLADLPDPEGAVDLFTSTHMDHVKDWYLKQQREDDLVISASPEFLISAFCRKLGIKHVMASPVEIHSGKYLGKNCHGREKVIRYREVFGDTPIEAFYSDSRSDTPLAELAQHAYLVKGDERKPWNQ